MTRRPWLLPRMQCSLVTSKSVTGCWILSAAKCLPLMEYRWMYSFSYWWKFSQSEDRGGIESTNRRACTSTTNRYARDKNIVIWDRTISTNHNITTWVLYPPHWTFTETNLTLWNFRKFRNQKPRFPINQTYQHIMSTIPTSLHLYRDQSAFVKFPTKIISSTTNAVPSQPIVLIHSESYTHLTGSFRRPVYHCKISVNSTRNPVFSEPIISSNSQSDNHLTALIQRSETRLSM